MSSDMKDARWQLAISMVSVYGWGYDDFDYRTWQSVLDAAQAILDHFPAMVPLLSEDFRS